MDLSVAPEIAQFTQPGAAALPPSGTVGERATALTALAADPARWWDRVRFDPAAPVRIRLDRSTWLLVIPPGHAASCDCALSTLLAGSATSGPSTTSGLDAPLRVGRTRVHGRPGGHTIHSGPAGYSVTLHASLCDCCPTSTGDKTWVGWVTEISLEGDAVGTEDRADWRLCLVIERTSDDRGTGPHKKVRRQARG
jgi:hypothetical protein